MSENGTVQLGRAGLWVTIASTSANLVAYLVPLLGARTLSELDFGTITLFTALLTICGVPGIGLQIATTMQVARHGSAPRLRRATWSVAALTVAGLAALTPVLTTVFTLGPPLLASAAVVAAAVVVGSGWLGVLQGQLRFGRLSAALVVMALAKAGGVILGLAFGLGVDACFALAAVVALVGVAAVRPLLGARGRAALSAPAGDPTPDHARMGRDVWAATSASLAMVVLSYVDVFAARELLPGSGVADYSVLAVLTKGAIWAPQAVGIVALPYFAKRNQNSRWIAAVAVLGVGVILAAATLVAGEFAVGLVGGAKYAGLGGIAPVFAATGALYSLVFVLANAAVAEGARIPAAPLWIAVGAFLLAVHLVPTRSVEAIVSCAFVTALSSATIMAALAFRRGRHLARAMT